MKEQWTHRAHNAVSHGKSNAGGFIGRLTRCFLWMNDHFRTRLVTPRVWANDATLTDSHAGDVVSCHTTMYSLMNTNRADLGARTDKMPN